LWAVVPLSIATALLAPTAAVAADVPEAGDQVWVGDPTGYGGTSLHAVFPEEPADPDAPGVPAFWAYCIEHDISARSRALGVLGDFTGYLGDNYVGDPDVQGLLLWVLAHSYPAVSLGDFGAAAGVPGIAENDAIEATQYAIWRYTDLTFDAAWAWETPDSEAAYWYLVNGANASGGMTPSDFETTVSITGPATPQVAGTLVGPFTVTTNQPIVSVAGGFGITDAAGAAIDTAAVVSGQEIYLDLRGTTAAGNATVTVSAAGSSATGKVISVPTVGGELTADDHDQTLILVTASTTSTTAAVAASWASVAAAAAPAATAPELPATGEGSPGVLVGFGLLVIVLGVALRLISFRRRARC
jgi:TQXA domain-containing protein/LPXTG-motif cell wall-anchored protein